MLKCLKVTKIKLFTEEKYTIYYSVSDYTSDGTYSFQGVPDGQYVLVVSGQKDGKYFETTSGTITVSSGNATMDVKLPVANPANPQQ